MNKFKQILAGCALLMATACTESMGENELTLLVGTYTDTGSKGIYTYRLNTETLQTTLLTETEVENPSFMAVSEDSKMVYAVSEIAEKKAVVNAYRFDKVSGELAFLNKMSVGDGPCYIWLHEEASFVATANYNAGSISVCPISEDGLLGLNRESYQYVATGPDSTRQEQSHLHCIQASPDGKMLFATDLGGDVIYKYKVVNVENKELESQGPISLKPGSGPRHLTFNTKGDKAYLINELSGMVSVFDYDGKTLKEVQSILSDTSYARGSADIHLSPDNRFLYASTRLKGDGISIFKVDEKGLLSRIGYQATEPHPRNFAISPSGNLLLVASRDSDCIQLFSRNNETGLLTDTHKKINVKHPAFVKCIE